MKAKLFTNSILSLAVITLFGCGGGGGGGDTPAPIVPVTPVGSATISGVAAKGPLNGADVAVYATKDGKFDIALGNIGTGKTSTDGTGKYSVTLTPAPTGPVVVVITNGSYTDEASGTPNVKLAAPLRAVVPAVVDGTKIAVTPFTELAFKKAAGTGTTGSVVTLTAASINDANAAIGNAFHLPDIIETLPVDPTNAAAAAAGSDEKAYSLALGTISQMAATAAGATAGAADLGKVTDNLLADLGTKVAASGGLTQASLSSFNAAANTFISDPNKNKTGSIIIPKIAFTGGVLSLSTGPAGALTVPGAADNVINGIDMTLTLPAGVTVNLKPGSNTDPADGVVTLSSAAFNSNSFAVAKFNPTDNTLRIVIVHPGFGIGEFMHVNFKGFPDGLDRDKSFPVTLVGIDGGDLITPDTKVLTGITISPTDLAGI